MNALIKSSSISHVQKTTSESYPGLEKVHIWKLDSFVKETENAVDKGKQLLAAPAAESGNTASLESFSMAMKFEVSLA